ncbi:hypothetical protein X975_08838, partial [Stegodyphus mimosarum]
MLPPDNAALQEYLHTCSALMSSKLAPWQRIDAMKTFFYPALSFDMRSRRFRKGDWARLDDFARPLLKETLNIPPEASNEYLYGDTAGACLGIPLAKEDSDIACVDGAFKLLTSRDPGVRSLAWADFISCIAARIGRTPTFQEMADFLSASDTGPFRGPSSSPSSTWSSARAASRRLKISWCITNEQDVSLSIDGDTIGPAKRNLIFKSLRKVFRSARAKKITEYPDQGKAIECAAAHNASCHFFREGDYTRFADWRFIHRARLNLVPLNASRKRFTGQGPRSCRRCLHPAETLPHVLCHCMRYSSLYQQRHNAVVNRIQKAALGRWTVDSANQLIPGTTSRPDLVLTREDA